MGEWKEEKKALIKTFTFGSFTEAIEFVRLVAVEGERVQHHPDMRISYAAVEMILSTHDADDITEKDRELAKIIDVVYDKQYEKQGT